MPRNRSRPILKQPYGKISISVVLAAASPTTPYPNP
jgi:hypothetical protein